MEKRIRVIFSGTVQGVGFRFAAERIARQFEVTGFVRNLPNGKVEMLAEGEDVVLKDFLRAVSDQMVHYITDVKTEWSQTEHRYRAFSIAF